MEDLRLNRRDVLVAAAAALSAQAVPAQATARVAKSRSKVRLLPDAHRIAARGEPLDTLTAVECAALLQARLVSSRELTAACLEAIAARDGALNSWVRVQADEADRQAMAADRRLSRAAVARRGRRAPLLCGIPLGLKDIFDVAGWELTAGSRILAGNRPTADSTAWSRLRHAGAIGLGHTQTHEFAAGNFTPQTANPWDVERTPGGSSGGSGAALAARMVPLALGSDTLGSLRIPASLCGVAALKPSFGLTSRSGVIALAPTFDHVGPMARSVADLGLLLTYLAGFDSSDGATAATRSGTLFPLAPQPGSKPLAGMRIGVPDQTFGGLEPVAAIASLVERFAEDLASLGARLVPVTAVRSAADNLSSPEGFQFFLTAPGGQIDRYHRRWFPQRAADYTDDVAFTLGLLRVANAGPSDQTAATRVVEQLRLDWMAAFRRDRIDALLQPAALVETPRRDRARADTQKLGDPMVVWNYTGFPSLCLQAGTSAETGLPVGVQLVGGPGRDATLLRIGVEVQARVGHHEPAPPGARA